MLRRGGRMSPSTRRALFIIPVWVLSNLWMWLWWLEPSHINFALLFVPLTVGLFYEHAFLPSLLVFFILKAKVPKRRIAQKGKRVALITTCVPSHESLYIIEKQLRAMTDVSYPHDNWILDEGNSQKVKALAKKYGVMHFSRKGIKKYNQPTMPFQKKTKAGNVNGWLDHVKRRKYDFFVQLDIDHIPKPNYLHKTLGYFRDPEVAWVQAPSVYGNLSYWTARGAAEQELVFQGPLQMGFYGNSATPLIVGSHCTYRTSAIQEINGFQATRAEDHLNTITLANKGYKGVYVPEVIAVGDGPETLSIYLAQQFAWAYSMFQIFIRYSPKLLKGMPLRRKLQSLFSLTWYPLWSTSYLVMFLSPVLALLLGRDVTHITPEEIAIHFMPLFFCTILVWWAGRPLMQPANVFLSWRGMILHAVRWPIILRALFNALFNIQKPYMITPKGKAGKHLPTFKLYRPFMIIGVIDALAIILSTLLYRGVSSEGQVVFALANIFFMLTVCVVDLDLHLRGIKPKKVDFFAGWLKPTAAVAFFMLVASSAIVFSPFVANQQVAAALYSEPKNLHQDQVQLTDMSRDQLINAIGHLPKNGPIEKSGIGIYSPGTLPYANRPYIRHSFVDWNNSRALALQEYISLYENDTPLITIEPKGEANGQILLTKIANGQYDDKLDNMAKVLGATGRPVYVRFAHEMELEGLYPWANQDPNLYIAAYRHVVTYTRSHGAKNVEWMWSPGGNPGASAYYPGDNYVDAIGTTILYDRYWSGNYHPSFYELQANRVWLQQFGKPVWIAEFGAGNSDPEFQQQLVQEAFSEYHQDGYAAIVYLNIPDSNIVGPDYRLRSLAPFGDLFTPRERSKPTEILSPHKPAAAHAQPLTQVNTSVLRLLDNRQVN